MITRPRIRQLGLGELLDESFRLYRNNFLNFLAIAALVLVPYTLVSILVQIPFQEQMALMQTQPDAFDGTSPIDVFSGMLFGLLGSVALGFLYGVVFQPLMEGSLAHGISQRYLDKPATVGDSFGAAIRRSPALIGARLIPALLGLLVFGAIFGTALGITLVLLRGGLGEDSSGGMAGAVLMGIASFGLFLMLGLVIALIAIRILFSSQAVMIEHHGPWEALKRSWRLTHGYFWRTLGYVFVIGLIVGAITSLPAAAITVPLTLLLPDQQRLQFIINTCVSAVMQVIATPFSMIAYTLMYYDLRIRKEAFDLEQRVQTILPPAMNAPVAEH